MIIRHAARQAAAASVVVIALVATGCAPEPAGRGSAAPDTSSSSAAPESPESPAPSATQEYAVPRTLPGEIARAVYEPTAGEDGSPQTTYTAVDAVASGVPFAVDGQCIGERVGFEVITAAPGDSGRVLVAGTLACGDPSPSGGYATPYSGLVQLLITPADDVEVAWLAVLPG